jgi:golgi phosphoprotein 3
MDMAHELKLYEEVLLLALDDVRGTAAIGSMSAYAIGGAILAELLLSGTLAIEQERKSKLVVYAGDAPGSDPLLNECLQRIRTAKRRASPQVWVSRFAGIKGLQKRIAERLRQKGVLRYQEGKVLWVFSRDTYPTVDPLPERDLTERIRAALTTDAPVDARTAIVLALAYPAGLLASQYDRKALRQHRKRIEALTSLEGGVAAQATTEAIQAVQAALMASSIAITAATAAS